MNMLSSVLPGVSVSSTPPTGNSASQTVPNSSEKTSFSACSGVTARVTVFISTGSLLDPLEDNSPLFLVDISSKVTFTPMYKISIFQSTVFVVSVITADGLPEE